jgi:hypothetical protein
MPLHEIAAPTIIEVNAAIRMMEEQYFSTREFVENAEKAHQVSDDDAQEWRYLLMQRRALERQHPYATVTSRKDYSLQDELQAQVEVAA